MKSNCVIILFLTIISNNINGQSNNTDLSIYLSPGGGFYAAYFPYNPSTCSDTIKEGITDNSYYMCFLKDCGGAMYFQAYKNNALVIEGEYVNTIDTLKHCILVNDGHDPNQPFVVKTQEYIEPLKDGVWTYYNNSGKLIRQEVWVRGVLISNNDNR